MAKPAYLVVFITTSSYEEARKIADALVDLKKAACVNIVPKVNSLFRWKGKIEDAEESLMVVKTRAELFPDVVSTVKSIHSYEVPEIIALPIIRGIRII
jgi:periplasmic divalent cation tolerance protein